MNVNWLSRSILIGLLSAALSWPTMVFAQERHATSWKAGRFSFSDEQGGFTIQNIRGKGTFDDPALLSIDIHTVGRGVLTIRQLDALNGLLDFNKNWTTLYIKYDILNDSPASWIGFRFELQEELGTPSIYGDGLSFNQITRDASNILSNRFSRYEVEHEPGDRLVFNEGWVDQADHVRFSIFLLDLTPAPVFYIQHVPHLPAS